MIIQIKRAKTGCKIFVKFFFFLRFRLVDTIDTIYIFPLTTVPKIIIITVFITRVPLYGVLK